MRTLVRTGLVVALYTATVASGVAVRAVYLTPEPPAAVVAPAPAPSPTPAPKPPEPPDRSGWGVGASAPSPAAAAPTQPPAPVEAPAAVPPSPPPPAAVSADVVHRSAIWHALADCESGAWGVGKVPVPGSARWDVVDEVHQGGLQIRAGQWDQHRPAGFPADAHVATPDQQIAVAEIILGGQGRQAWPTCGPRVGLQRLVGEEIVEPD